jgi:hypothetical protein
MPENKRHFSYILLSVLNWARGSKSLTRLGKGKTQSDLADCLKMSVASLIDVY